VDSVWVSAGRLSGMTWICFFLVGIEVKQLSCKDSKAQSIL